MSSTAAEKQHDAAGAGPERHRTVLADHADRRRWYQLSTQFRGSNVCLDIFNCGSHDNEPHLTGCRNLTGQHWKYQAPTMHSRERRGFAGPRCALIFSMAAPTTTSRIWSSAATSPGKPGR